MSTRTRLAATLLSLCSLVVAQSTTVLDPPGQPTKTGVPGTFEIVGNSGVSAQQLFLGNENKIYVVDKTEGNPMKVKGHPAWASEYDIDTNAVRAMDVVTNSFCAGGNFLGDGTLINVGGNQAVTTGGDTPAGYGSPASYGGKPYEDYDGGAAIRLLTACEDESCNWQDNSTNYMTTRRWYPTLETLADGTMFIIGGDTEGGYVNNNEQNNPTYEFFPSKGDPVESTILENTLPANLYPLTWLLPSGKLFIQTNWATELLNLKTGVETMLANIPHAVRTYPASGASTMLPLTPANNYTATILFCGGSNVQKSQWTDPSWIITQWPADDTCVRITPDGDKKWYDDATLPVGRTMGNFIILPDGNIFLVNGGELGTAGYGTQSWTIGDSFADAPILQPLMYFPENQTFSSEGLQNSTITRLYHSTALLLPDGSVFIAGSNPHPDYSVGSAYEYPTEYRTERFYPWYYSERRPEPNGLLSSISYGGEYFNVSLTPDDMFGDSATNANLTKAVILRTGFSTHGLQMGQRYVELETTYTLNTTDNTVILHVSQLPPNANILAPGPAMIHIVVNGVPSVGKMIMVGSGKIETQTLNTVVPLPPSGTVQVTNTTSNNGTTGDGGKKTKSGAANVGAKVEWGMGLALGVVVMALSSSSSLGL